MRTFIYFLFTCFISTGAFFAAMNQKNPWPCFAVAYGIWALFIWGYNKRSKKIRERRSMERQFEDFMRKKSRH